MSVTLQRHLSSSQKLCMLRASVCAHFLLSSYFTCTHTHTQTDGEVMRSFARAFPPNIKYTKRKTEYLSIARLELLNQQKWRKPVEEWKKRKKRKKKNRQKKDNLVNNRNNVVQAPGCLSRTTLFLRPLATQPKMTFVCLPNQDFTVLGAATTMTSVQRKWANNLLLLASQ